MFDMWKAAGPHIDVIAPDIHVPGVQGFKNVMQQFTRPDNPLFIPETDGYGATRGNDGQGRLEFLAVGAGSFGFSPFGIDRVTFGSDGKLDVERQGLAENNRLLVPSGDVIAQLQYEGKIQTAVEEPGLAQIELPLGDWTALVSFPPAFDSAVPNDGGSPSARLKMGRVLIAPIATNEFLVIGIDAQVSFHRTSIRRPCRPSSCMCRKATTKAPTGRVVASGTETRRTAGSSSAHPAQYCTSSSAPTNLSPGDRHLDFETWVAVPTALRSRPPGRRSGRWPRGRTRCVRRARSWRWL